MLELFSGSKIMSNTFKDNSFDVFTLDNEVKNKPDYCIDILKINACDIIRCFGKPDVIWSSPPCNQFSLCRDRRKIDIEKYKLAVEIHLKGIQIIKELNPQIFFIENPMAYLQHESFMKEFFKYELTQCQYGHIFRKPTNIFSNLSNLEFKKCKRNNNCHIGGFDRYDKKKRAILPKGLCDYIVKISKEKLL
jgi:site-specific DNA-cytosine methylase